jgi:hypothetical protein
LTDTVPRQVGRPTLCNDTVIQGVCEAIRKHLPLERACDMLGISDRVRMDWVQRGVADEAAGLSGEDSIYVRFARAVKQTRAEMQAESLARIAAASERNPACWTADAWLLERTDSLYALQNKVQIDRNDRQSIRIEYAVSAPDPVPSLPGPSVEGEFRELNAGPKTSDLDTPLSESDAANP